MNSVTHKYRDPENGDEYMIKYEPNDDGTITIWALDSPPNPFGGSVTDHHLYDSGEVCVVADAKPRNLDRAKAFAVYWMNRYSVFVRTGSFPKTPGRVRV